MNKNWVWGFLLLTSLSGCKVCEDLDAKICTDLGAEDCKIWKEKQLNFTVLAAKSPSRGALKTLIFGEGAEFCRSADSSSVYPKMLAGAKGQVAAYKDSAAKIAADNDKRAKEKVLRDAANAKRVQELELRKAANQKAIEERDAKIAQREAEAAAKKAGAAK